MRYKPKSIAALHIALGGLPVKMRVEADPDIGVSAKSVGELRKVTAWPEKFGDNHPARTLSRKRSKGEQGQRGNSLLAQTLGHAALMIAVRRARAGQPF
jgi:hypothetical protein